MHHPEKIRVNVYAAGVALLWTTALAIPTRVAGAESISEVVSLADLDTQSARGRSEAAERIARAARRLCNRFRNFSGVDDRENYVECVRGIKVQTRAKAPK